MDFAGPFLGKSFFVLVDAHSKWPEVFEMAETTTAKTIAVLRHLFASYGLPEQLVSDNGPQFVSADFAQFLKANGVKHSKCAPYHPSSNGAAEHFVRTFKQAMKAGKSDGRAFSHRLENFLLAYRTPPHATTNVAPATLFLGRCVRTRFDLLKPSVEQTVQTQQSKQKDQHDQHAHNREFTIGDKVMAKNFRPGQPWVPGTIVHRQGPLSFSVDLGNGQVWRRHIDHLRARGDGPVQPEPVDTEHNESDDIPFPVDDPECDRTDNSSSTPTESTTPSTSSELVTTSRYPTRDRRPPDRLM